MNPARIWRNRQKGQGSIMRSGSPERLEKRNMIRKGQNGSGILMMLGMILAKLWMNTAVLVILSGQNC